MKEELSTGCELSRAELKKREGEKRKTHLTSLLSLCRAVGFGRGGGGGDEGRRDRAAEDWNDFKKKKV